MRLVWATIPLVLLGIFGISESFGEEQDFILYDNKNNYGCADLRMLQQQYNFEDIRDGKVCTWSSGHAEISLHLTTNSSGTTTFEIPRMILDSRNENCEDKPFQLLLREMRLNRHNQTDVYRTQIKYTEISDEKFRNLTFETPKFEVIKENEFGFNSTLTRIIINIEGNQNGYSRDSCRTQILSQYSPAEQVRYGEYSNNVNCSENKKLIFKNDWSPACVKDSSAVKLVNMEWARSETSPIKFIIEKNNFKVGEDIKIIMKNIGKYTFQTSSIPIGFSIFNLNEKRICSWAGPWTAVGFFAPGMNVTQNWDQVNCSDDNNPVKQGAYEIRGDHFYEFQLRKTPIHKFNIIE